MVHKFFSKGEYIVTLEIDDKFETYCANNGYCFKQESRSAYLNIETNLIGVHTTGNPELKADKSGMLKNWRYATKQEEAIYDALGKPFDTRTIPMGCDYVTIVTDCGRKAVAKYLFKGDEKDHIRFVGNFVSDMNGMKGSFSLWRNSQICFASKNRTWRKSTQGEIDWLNACIKAGHFVHPIESFLERIEGRWIKAKKNYPVSIPMVIGERGKIHSRGLLRNGTIWAISEATFHEDFELLPEDYEPKEGDPEFIKKPINDVSGSTKNEKSSINNNLNSRKNGTGKSVKVQRVTPTIREGERISGNRISGRTNKVAITSRPVVHQAIIGS